MKQVPNVYWARELKEWQCEQSTKIGTYIMARPYGFFGLCLMRRIKIALKVFTGEYDAVRWSDF